MDKIKNYRTIIRKILQQHAAIQPSTPGIALIPIADEESDNYLLMNIGWYPQSRAHHIIFHLRIINEKIWIEWDGTEYGVAQELLDAGLSRQEIVLAFYHPDKTRRLTDFAIT